MSISESHDNSLFVGVQREYYKLGKLKSEVFVNAGKKEGEYKEYYDYDYDYEYNYDKSYYDYEYDNEYDNEDDNDNDYDNDYDNDNDNDNDNDYELSKNSINSYQQLFRISNYIDDKQEG